MAKLFSIFLIAGLLSAAADATWDPFKAMADAFRTEGYSEQEILVIRDHLLSDEIHSKRWPFTDYGKELAMSVANEKNNNAGEVAEAITNAGGDPANPSGLAEEAQTASINSLAAPTTTEHGDHGSGAIPGGDHGAAPIPGSLLQRASLAHVVSVPGLEQMTAKVSLMAGEVATNRLDIEKLWGYAKTNEALVGRLRDTLLTSDVANFVKPTQQLALTFGLNPTTMASLSLAGSFVGPMLGVMALVYAAWPEEEVDPWLQVESRVANMLSEKFDAKRRKKLGDRMRRYIKQFSRCSQAWIASSMTQLHGVPIPQWLVKEAARAKEGGGTFQLNSPPHTHSFPVPRCMSQLEGHMSIERDEWFGTSTGSFSGLFMPFANMHTQILSLLTDNPHNQKMAWPATQKVTSAEYGAYMVKHLLASWKGHVCRTMRLRHSLKGGPTSWRYSWVVMREVQQPNGGQECLSSCDSKSGWCNFCGGKGIGACCAPGDGGICKAFDAPFSASLGSVQSTCVTTDCIQKNSGYYSSQELKVMPEDVVLSPEECQVQCAGVENAVAFRSKDKECVCLGEEGLKRHTYTDGYSGLTKCQSQETLTQLETKLGQNVEELTRVPMEEAIPCEKSPVVSNYAEVEEKHGDWIKTCYKEAGAVMTAEFNKFHMRFAKFVDSLTWKAGCAAQHEVDLRQTGDGVGYLAVSNDFDGGSFNTCNWKREEKNDESTWRFDDSSARGWTGTSRVNMEEQATAKMEYPMPAWLHDLKKVQACLKNTAAGNIEDASNDQSAAVGAIMDPISSDTFEGIAADPAAS